MEIKELELKPPSKKAMKFFKKFMSDHDKGLKAIKAIEKIKEVIKYHKVKGHAFCDVRLFKIEEIVNEVEDAL